MNIMAYSDLYGLYELLRTRVMKKMTESEKEANRKRDKERENDSKWELAWKNEKENV